MTSSLIYAISFGIKSLSCFTIQIHIQTDFSTVFYINYQLSFSIRIESFADSIGSSYLLLEWTYHYIRFTFVSVAP